MSELIALALASLPVVALVLLVIETIRTGNGTAAEPPVSLMHRAYGA